LDPLALSSPLAPGEALSPALWLPSLPAPDGSAGSEGLSFSDALALIFDIDNNFQKCEFSFRADRTFFKFTKLIAEKLRPHHKIDAKVQTHYKKVQRCFNIQFGSIWHTS
jgi:hypothetical protein